MIFLGTPLISMSYVGRLVCQSGKGGARLVKNDVYFLVPLNLLLLAGVS